THPPFPYTTLFRSFSLQARYFVEEIEGRVDGRVDKPDLRIYDGLLDHAGTQGALRSVARGYDCGAASLWRYACRACLTLPLDVRFVWARLRKRERMKQAVLEAKHAIHHLRQSQIVGHYHERV